MIEIWLETILGIKNGHDNEIGLLGRVSAYYGTVETQGRGSLHLHMLIWVHGAWGLDQFLANVSDLNQNSDFKHDMINYLSTIIKEQFPDDGKMPDFVDVADTSICSQRPPNTANEDEVKSDLEKLVKVCNLHKHTPTCYKYGHETCRFDFERPSVEEAKIENGVVYLQRKPGNGYVNNYNDIMMGTLRCNHDIKFIVNGLDGKGLAFYITSYITKKALTTHNAFPLMLAACQDIEKNIHPCQKNPLYSDAQQRSRDLVIKCLNKLTTHSERSGPEIASKLLGKPNHYKSHTFVKLYLRQFINAYPKELTSTSTLSTSSPLTSSSSSSSSSSFTPTSHSSTSSSSHSAPSAASNSSSSTSQSSSCPPISSSDSPLASAHPLDSDEHSFDIIQTPKGLALTNQAIDYTSLVCLEKHRPCLYDYISQYYKFLIPKTKGKRRHSSADLNFDEFHPQHKTHSLRKRHPHQYVVPVIIGPTFPQKEKDPEKYAMLFLFLFKPFNKVDDIKLPNQTWYEAYQTWDRTLLDHDTFVKLENFETNIQDSVQGLQQKKKEQEDRAELRREQNITETSKFICEDPFDSLFAGPDTDDNTSGPTHVGLDLPAPNLKTSLGVYALTALTTLATIGGLAAPSPPQTAPSSAVSSAESVFIWPTHPDHAFLSHPSKLTSLKDNLHTQVETLRANPNINMNTSSSTSTIPIQALTKHVIQNIIIEFTLNEKQSKAFTKVGDTLLATLSPETSPPQLIAYIGGPGGTGKSQLIKAIQHMFKTCGKMSSLKTMSFTGTASSNVNGSTMSSSLKDQRTSSNSLKINTNQLGALQSTLQNVNFIIFDEVSMLSTFNMAKLDARLKQAKQSKIPFGGIHMIFLGDFLQYPPVCGTPLYTRIQKHTSQGKHNNNHQEPHQTHLSGRSLWVLVNFAIFLDQQMRQDDEDYLSTLTFLRHTNTTGLDTHYTRLISRVLGPKNTTLSIADFWHAPLLTARNVVRSAVNFAKTKALAKSLHIKQIVILAGDRVTKGADALSPKTKLDYLNLLDNDTGDLIGMLTLVPNMPLILKKNIGTEIGLCNGTHCRLSRVILHPDETPFDMRSDIAAPHFLRNTPC